MGGVRRVSTDASLMLGTKLSVLADFLITSAEAWGRGRLSDPHLYSIHSYHHTNTISL